MWCRVRYCRSRLSLQTRACQGSECGSDSSWPLLQPDPTSYTQPCCPAFPELLLLLSAPLSVNSVHRLAGKLLVSNGVASLPGSHVHWFGDGTARAEAGAV